MILGLGFRSEGVSIAVKALGVKLGFGRALRV